jgi:ATPase subunit of ABC transporter with duplicated ATPase domains
MMRGGVRAVPCLRVETWDSQQRYEGTVLLVTHDHDLIDEVATRLWVFREDGIEDFQGPYAEWKGKHN